MSRFCPIWCHDTQYGRPGGSSWRTKVSEPLSSGQVMPQPQPDSPLLLVEMFPNGRSVGDKIFKTGGFEKTFAEAQKICRQAGGEMASPRSAAENEAVQQLAIAQNKNVFLGTTNTNGKFTYPTGQPLVYSNWAPGEPNDDRGAEKCVELYTNGKWNDKKCSENRLVVCEF